MADRSGALGVAGLRSPAPAHEPNTSTARTAEAKEQHRDLAEWITGSPGRAQRQTQTCCAQPPPHLEADSDRSERRLRPQGVGGPRAKAWPALMRVPNLAVVPRSPVSAARTSRREADVGTSAGTDLGPFPIEGLETRTTSDASAESADWFPARLGSRECPPTTLSCDCERRHQRAARSASPATPFPSRAESRFTPRSLPTNALSGDPTDTRPPGRSPVSPWSTPRRVDQRRTFP
jgi:hypothetical protein